MIADMPQIFRYIQSLTDLELRHRLIDCGLPDSLVTARTRPRMEKLLAQHMELQVKLAFTKEPLASLRIYEVLFETPSSRVPKYQEFCNRNLLQYKNTVKEATTPPAPLSANCLCSKIKLKWRRSKLLIQNWCNRTWFNLTTKATCFYCLGFVVVFIATVLLSENSSFIKGKFMRFNVLIGLCGLELITCFAAYHYIFDPNGKRAAEYLKNEILQQLRARAQCSEIPEERAVGIDELQRKIVYDKNPLLIKVWDKVLYNLEKRDASVQFGLEIAKDGSYLKTIKYVGDLP